MGLSGRVAVWGDAAGAGMVETTFPLGTMVVNLSGCFVLGFLYALADERASANVRLGVAVGFVGAYTTFSTLMFDSSKLARR